MKALFAIVLAGGLTAACAVGPSYQRAEVALPEEIRGAAPATDSSVGASLADRAWWEIVDDASLEDLIDQALKDNHEVRLAAWRVEEARAKAGIAGSAFLPRVQASGGLSRSQQSKFFSPVTDTLDLYDVNLGLSWELDFWGRIRHLNEAALAGYLATEEARRGVFLSLVSEVAIGYFRLRALDLQLEIAQRSTEAFEETHTLFNRRFEAGLASGLETSSAEASLAGTAASIPELARQIAAQENALAVLLGRSPGEIPRGAALGDQELPIAIPAGLPSDLLRRRPDLRVAEQELVVANAEVGIAVANFFPTFSLTGAFGGVAPQISNLVDEGRTWSVGGGLLSPLFQGKRLRDEHRAALARREQAKVRFEQSVTTALAEVATALVAYQKLAEVERQQARAVEANHEAVELAGTRYLSGLADYLEVLRAQQQLFPAETALAQTRFERLATLVRLYRALGGGWQLADPEWTGERTERLASHDLADAVRESGRPGRAKR